MSLLADMVCLARRNVGRLCSVHFDLVRPVVQFQWARVCRTGEQADMIECEFESAALPGQTYGLRFDGIAHYQSDNQDNLQVGYLVDVTVSGEPPSPHCKVRLDSPSSAATVAVEFDFAEWSVLTAPERREKLV
jgi:hypothetical protein